MPDAAVTEGGAVTVRRGSTIATRARMCGLTIPFFMWLPSGFTSVRMQLGVTSLPVPAVVGKRIIGSAGFGTFPTPHICSRGVSFARIAAVALAISSGLPPPRPTMPLGANRRANSALRRAVSTSGSGSTSSNTSTATPDALRHATASDTESVFSCRTLSVTSTTRVAPSA